ncbi:PIN domain nuclease [bacterium]|nr:PIN domain nuclease [bacterium]
MLVDSSVWIDYFNGLKSPQTDYFHAVLGQTEILVGDLILTEVLQGFRRKQDYTTAKSALLTFEVREMVGKDIALKSVDHYRFLRNKGITIRKTIDCLIATFCIQNKIELLHSDHDFDPFVRYLGLQIPEF